MTLMYVIEYFFFSRYLVLYLLTYFTPILFHHQISNIQFHFYIYMYVDRYIK